MRFLITLLLIAFVVANAAAQVLSKGKLSISTTGTNTLYIVINKYDYLLGNGNKDLTLRQLEPGEYPIKIYRLIRNDLPTDKWNNYSLIYDNKIMVKAGYHNEVTVNRFANVFSYELQITNYNNTDEWNSTVQVSNDPWLGSSSPGNSTGGNNSYISNAMSDAAFTEFKNQMNNELFEDRKVQYFKNNARNNLFTAQQVKTLCLLFNFDRYKLELAKAAYDYTVDKGNYFLLYDVFTFSSYKKDLQTYISNK